MRISIYKILWFTVSVLISGYICHYAYLYPEKFSPLVDLLATIVSILIGVSLAISAVLSSRPIIGDIHYRDEDERKRMEKILNCDDRALIEGQNFIFWFYYSTLLLAVIFKWLTASGDDVDTEIFKNPAVKITSAAFAFVSTMSLIWSATLPSLLRSIGMLRKNLE